MSVGREIFLKPTTEKLPSLFIGSPASGTLALIPNAIPQCYVDFTGVHAAGVPRAGEEKRPGSHWVTCASPEQEGEGFSTSSGLK